MKTEDIWKTAGAAQQSFFLENGGRMADRIRTFDWSNTAIGPIDTWSASLRSVVQMALLSQQAICLVWGPDLTFLYNDAYAPILGQRESGALGQRFEDVWPDVWDDISPIVCDALSGKGTWFEDMALTMTRNGVPEETYWSFSYSPLYDVDRRIAGMINIAMDTTTSVLNRRELGRTITETAHQLELQLSAEAQQRVIQREMAHRIKNILSMTMAVVSQSLRHSASLDDASTTITRRIDALANVQDILTSARNSDADVRDLITQTLQPYQTPDSRIRLNGPDIIIHAQQALGMALAIHELATNAVKYGALSNDSGIVTVIWKDGDRVFDLLWEETGGPPATAPTRKGFGSRLLSRIVPSYFSGEAQLFYNASGVRYELHGTIDDGSLPTSETIDPANH